jgi:hypothetical protein
MSAYISSLLRMCTTAYISQGDVAIISQLYLDQGQVSTMDPYVFYTYKKNNISRWYQLHKVFPCNNTMTGANLAINIFDKKPSY